MSYADEFGFRDGDDVAEERGGYTIKDSGKRQEFEGGMVRDTEDDKVDYSSLAFGPMLYRWAMHCTKGRIKYPDPKPGVPNWTLAKGVGEYLRFRASAFRHFMAWFWGLQDEDHAAGVFFNINGAEYVKRNMWSDASGMCIPDEPPMAPINQPPSPEDWQRAREELRDGKGVDHIPLSEESANASPP